MQFISVSLLALGLGLSAITSAAALPAQHLHRADIAEFYLIATRSTTPIHLSQLEARDGQLWVGGATSYSCSIGENCSGFHNFTGFIGEYGSGVKLDLDEENPAGETPYLAADGSIHYTPVGDDVIPESASTDIWDLLAPASSSVNSFGSVTPADSTLSLLACPATAAEKQMGPWAVCLGPAGAEVPSGNAVDCWTFQTLTSNLAGPYVWQYE